MKVIYIFICSIFLAELCYAGASMSAGNKQTEVIKYKYETITATRTIEVKEIGGAKVNKVSSDQFDLTLEESQTFSVLSTSANKITIKILKK